MPDIEWDERASAEANARQKLPTLVREYFAEVRGFLAKNPTPEKLHRLRLATKRLRYTLELFRPCYGRGLEIRIAELRKMQQLLGNINDRVAAGKLVAKAMHSSPRRTQVRELLAARAGQKAREFRKHWTTVFDAPGRERWWISYLRRAKAKTARRLR
jgi:CHAD domain-containing protein